MVGRHAATRSDLRMVGRLLQESVVFVYPDSGDKWIDESAELDVVPSLEPNVAAEENARRFAEQGGVGVVLRFGYFYGPGAIHTEEILKFARRSEEHTSELQSREK